MEWELAGNITIVCFIFVVVVAINGFIVRGRRQGKPVRHVRLLSAVQPASKPGQRKAWK